MFRSARSRAAWREAQDFPDAIGIDETAFQRRHQYVTVISSGDRVLHVADDRKRSTLDAWYAAQPAEALAGLRTVSMDMWGPFIDSTLAHVPSAEHKIAFDKFHVAKHLGDAVDKVRRAEHKACWRARRLDTDQSRYLWLQHPDNMTDKSWGRLNNSNPRNLKTARAWAIKTHAMCRGTTRFRGWARRAWMTGMAGPSARLDPVKKVARTIKRHLEGRF